MDEININDIKPGMILYVTDGPAGSIVLVTSPVQTLFYGPTFQCRNVFAMGKELTIGIYCQYKPKFYYLSITE